MPQRFCLLLLLFGILLPGRAQLQSPAPFVVRGLGRATVPIGGTWKFHTGDNPAWASPTYDDSSWAHILVGESWEPQGYKNYTGFAWYRRHIDIPKSSANLGWPLAINLPAVQDAAQIFWNGRLVGSYGTVPPNPVWYFQGPVGHLQLSPFLPAFVVLGKPQSGVLAIRVWKAPYAFFSFPNEGGLIGKPLLGSAAALDQHNQANWYGWLRSNLWPLGIALLSGIITLLALLAWLRDRSQWMLLWLAVYTLHPLALLPLIGIPGLLSFRWGYGLLPITIGTEDISLWFLLLYLLNLRENPRLVRWTWWIAAFALLGNISNGVVQFFHWTTWPPHRFLTLDVYLTVPVLVIQLWGVILVLFAFRRRLDAARWFLAIVAMLADFNQALGNWFSLGARWTHWTFWQPFQQPLFSLFGNPLNAEDILNTLLLVAIVYAVWRYQNDQYDHQMALEQEYRSAEEVQRVLIPDALPTLPGYTVTSAYRPAQVVGGDFFQIVPLPAQSALIVLGDVSGKGLHAAMTVSTIVGLIRAFAESTSDPAGILAALNRTLHGRLGSGFATCLALRLDPHGNCQIANAGHLPPYLNGVEVPLPPALPLGLVPQADFESIQLQIPPGTNLVVYTDGLLEARNPQGELYGFERIAQLLQQQPHADQIAQAAQSFGQEDDITVLTLKLASSEAALA